MPNLFLSNFEFEDQLAGRTSNPTMLSALRQSLAATWMPVAQPGDALFEPTVTDDHSLSINSRPETDLRIVGPDSLKDFAGYNLTPWGWSKEAVQFANDHSLKCVAPPIKAVRKVNDRAFSFGFEVRNKIGLPGMSSITSADEFVEAVEQCLAGCADRDNDPQRWIVKTAFSSSARHCLRGFGKPTPQHVAWVGKRIHQSILYVEPFVERMREAGLQFTITNQNVVYNGCAELFNDQNGQYKGSVVTPLSDSPTIWQPCVDMAHQAVREIAELGYQGAIGIDCMQYRAKDGQVKFRAVQDVNARWTMGRMAIESLRFAAKNESVAMFHFNDSERGSFLDRLPGQFSGSRIIQSCHPTKSQAKLPLWVVIPDGDLKSVHQALLQH